MNNQLLKCSLVIMAMIYPCLTIAGEHFAFKVQVVKDDVHLRAGNSTNYESLIKLPKGTILPTEALMFDWYKVGVPENVKVYIRADYLTQVNANTYEVNGDRVNVRARPNTEATSVGQLLKAAPVEVIEIADNWALIKPTQELRAYIHQSLVTPYEEPVTATPSSVTASSVTSASSAMPVNAATSNNPVSNSAVKP